MEKCSVHVRAMVENITNSDFLDFTTFTYAITSAIVTFACLSIPIKNDKSCPTVLCIVPCRILLHILTFIFQLPLRYIATTALLYQMMSLRKAVRQHFFAQNTLIDITCLLALCTMDILHTAF